MDKSPIQTLHALGQSLWYDNIERRLLENGELEALITSGDIRGVTSNPSIFQNAISNSKDYDPDLQEASEAGLDPLAIYEALAISDIQQAADLFRPLYKSTEGGDGYVSLEVNPHLARDTAGTIAEASRLWERVDRPNLMVKIPATREWLPAITESIASGLNINITLIFSLARYREVIEAYLAGLERRLEAGEQLDSIASVASFFVSRVDSKVDPRLEAIARHEGPQAGLALSLRGEIAVANARLAYQIFKEAFQGERFGKLAAEGARIQRPLWASTSTKNPAYSDVKYVEELIGKDTVNTVPPATLAAYREHGQPQLTLQAGTDEAEKAIKDLEALGVSMADVTRELEEEGVKAFASAFDGLIASIEERLSGGL